MPPKFIYKRKRENWDREADRELKRRDKVVEKEVAAETRKRERAEFLKWSKEIGEEKKRRVRVAVAGTKKRERAEFLKWNKEIQAEETRSEILRDLNEEKGWRGSKKFAQIRRRFRPKFERRKPPRLMSLKPIRMLMQNSLRIWIRTKSTYMVTLILLPYLKKH